MLSRLRIQNLAVVEDVTLEFGAGLNVLTGSTGAGKSLILGAVNLLLGRRANASIIRAGRDRAAVEAIFESPAGPGVEGCRIVLRREVRANGRSFAFIDGASAPVKQLQETCSLWIEPHGQNEQLRLRDPATHVGYLDAYGGHDGLLEHYRESLSGFTRAGNELADFDRRVALLREKEELLRHRITEIGRAEIEPGEMKELESSIRLMENSERVVEALAIVHGLLEGDDDGADGTTAAVSRAVRGLSRVADVDARLGEFVSQLEEAEVTLRDCADGVRSWLDGFEFDPGRLGAIRDRRSYLFELERRYGMDADDLVARCEKWRRELDSVAFEDEERGELEERRRLAAGALQKAAAGLTRARRKAARELDGEMTRELEALVIKGARFRSVVEPDLAPDGHLEARGKPVNAGPDGADVVRFLVRTNPGEVEGPVDEIASTGEISRISLALKQTLQTGRGRAARRAVLVFDELDAGIGADLGDVIAEKLLELSARYQIICITHMPQIAAVGERHLVVSKSSRDGRTVAGVTTVAGEERRREVARMLGGREGSDKRIALAGELLAGRPQSRRP